MRFLPNKLVHEHPSLPLRAHFRAYKARGQDACVGESQKLNMADEEELKQALLYGDFLFEDLRRF